MEQWGKKGETQRYWEMLSLFPVTCQRQKKNLFFLFFFFMFLSFKGFAYSRSANFKSVFLQQSYKMHCRLGDVGWRQMFYKTPA